MNVGFLGLGTMGRAMAANLIKAGHTLTVWNRSPAPAEQLAALGARIAATPAEALAPGVAISMLADDSALSGVLTDATLTAAPKGLLHINMATVSVAASKALAEKHRALGHEYIGAPVFGRAEVAAAGQLNIVAGGSEAALAKAEPLFSAMGKRTWRVGTEPHQAHLLKIGGNFMLATTIELLSEATALMEKGGVDPRAFTEVMTNTLFAAPAFKIYSDLINDKRFEPAGFTMRLGLKDVGLALAAAHSAEMPLPLASLLRDHMLEGLASGRGEKDWSALSEVVRRKAGL